MLKCLSLGLGAALGGALLLILLSAALLAFGLPDGWIPFFAHLTALCSALCGGFCAGMKSKERGLVMGALAGGTVVLLHGILSLLWGEVSFSLLSFGALELMGGTLGGIFGVNLRK